MDYTKLRMLGWLFRSSREIEGEVNEEIAFHLEMRTAALMREGHGRAAAEAQARREFGDAADLRVWLRQRDERRQRRLRAAIWLDELRQDLRFAWRSLLRTPAFTVVAVCTLVLGIGTAVATFTVVNAVVLRPLPYADPDRIVRLSPGQNFNIMLAELMEASVPGLAAVSGVSEWSLTLTGAGDAAELAAQVVEPAYFDVFAVRPALGRLFRDDEREAERSDVVLLSDATWRSRFGGDAAVIGRRIRLDGYGHGSREVIGIMPAGFAPPLLNPGSRADLWIPLTFTRGRTVATDSSWYVNNLVARLQPGVQVSDVARDVRAAMARERAQNSRIAEDAVRNAGAAGLLDSMVGDVRHALWTLLGAVGLVLLLACANLANLMLARGARRRQELAARAALGGTRSRLVRELITESAVLAAVGAAIGLLLAQAVLGTLRVADAGGLPRSADLSIDLRVILFAMAVTTACVVLFGMLPALRATAGDLRPALGPGTRVRGQTRSARRFGSLLISAEVALAMVLITGAGLLIASFRSVRAVDPGIDTHDVLAMRVSPPPARYDGARAVQFYDELFERLRNLPGVAGVGAIHLLPFTGGNWSFPYLAEGHEPPVNAPLPSANFRVVASDYFDAVDVPLLAGRAFAATDRPDGVQVGIINRSLAEQLWPGQPAVGREILLFGSSPFTVIGVIDDVRQHGLDSAPLPEIYRPITQWTLSAMTVTIESTMSTARIAPLARDVVRALDADIPVDEARPLDAILDESLARRRFFAGVLTTFGAVALLLGSVGIYGVMTYAAGSRSAEFGVRLALGATDGDVLRMAFASGALPVGVGLFAGALAALASARLLGALLFGIQPHDPVTLLTAALILGAVGSLASWLPARRCTRVEPMRVLALCAALVLTAGGCESPSGPRAQTGPGLGPGASLEGRRPFPPDNPWNTDISDAPVDDRSAALVKSCGVSGLHPDFGTTWDGAPNGIPYIVVSGSQPRVPVTFEFADESDPGPYPIPADAPIEGGRQGSGDRHVIVLDRDDWTLYELFDAHPQDGGRSWRAGSGAIFDLSTNALRPAGWTSADAAGLPIFPGLVRYDEVVEQGEIRHALRFTCPMTRRAYVPPARHWASIHTSDLLPPMGMRVRLRADTDISGLSPEATVILTALKRYGMILADNGSSWFISGAPDPRWDDEALADIRTIPGSRFEVIRMDGLVTP